MMPYTHSDSPKHEPGTLPMCAGCEAMLAELRQQVADAYAAYLDLEHAYEAMERQVNPPPPIDPNGGWAMVLRARYA